MTTRIHFRAGTPVRHRWAVLTSALVLISTLAAPAANAGTASPAQVSVDFAKNQGPLWHGERYNNFTQAPTWQGARASDVAYLNRSGLHGSVYRVWAKVNWCGGSATSCTLPSDPASPTGDVAGYLANATAASDAILVNFDISPMIKQGMTPAQAKPLLKQIVKTVKANYPKVTYIEAFNEPDAPDKRGYMNPALVYPYYADLSQITNEVNAELKPSARLQAGGPAFFEFDPVWIGKFLDDYAADTDPAKRLDFFSYHGYIEFGDMANLQDPRPYKNNPRVVEGRRAKLQAMLTARHLDPGLPALITESGVYPGPLCDDCTDMGPATTATPWYTTDYVRQAAGQASLLYWYANEPKTYAFNWVTRHSSNERKDQFVTRGPGCTSVTTADGASTTTTCPGGPVTDALTPYGNSLLMQSMMKKTRVSATSDSLDANGIGVYALAAQDPSGASVLVWNYQNTGSTSVQARIDMSNLPANLGNGCDVRVKVYRVDQNTSNYYATPDNTDLAKAKLQQVDERTVVPAKGYTYQADLQPNAMYLLLLSRA